jgi:carbonic anhydrase
MITQTKDRLAEITPDKALGLLKTGNRRFVENKREARDLLKQTAQTSEGQHPFAVVLGCVDSRVPLELVFDLGIGDIFGIRIAGNIVNEDILGSMEFAAKISGSKHILVLGHTNCGAVQGAKDNVVLGNLTGLINKLQPAVEAVKKNTEDDLDIDRIAEKNVLLSVKQITEKSPILRELVETGQISISGGMYDVATGKVTFL